MSLTNSDFPTDIIEALRAENRYRTWFATVLAATISITYVGSTSDVLLSQFPRLRPAGHFVAAFILFVAAFGLALIIKATINEYRRRSAGLSILRSSSVRRILCELNHVFGMRVVAVALGGGKDGRILAMSIKNHNIVGIGRGTLSSIHQEPEGFRYRLAHELAHIAAGDPRRDDWLWAVYATTTLFLMISFGSALIKALSYMVENSAVGGWSQVKQDLLVWRFGLVANVVLFGSITLVLALERQSAARLREFYADAVATRAVGLVEHVFVSSGNKGTLVGHIWARFLAEHPEPAVRAAAITDRSTVYRADMMLFVLQGFFSSYILEMLLQLMFSSAGSGLANYDDRRASLWRFFSINTTITSFTIAFYALLALLTHVLVLRRLTATCDVVTDLRSHLSLIFSVPKLVLVGTLLLLATSQGVLWDLQQTGWNLPRYVLVAWDRLTMHGITLIALCVMILFGFLVRPRRNLAFFTIGFVPVLVALITGYILYS